MRHQQIQEKNEATVSTGVDEPPDNFAEKSPSDAGTWYVLSDIRE